MKRPSVLFVCLGNICRSPLAEAILRKKYGEYFSRIDSAGTSDYHVGDGADPRTVRCAHARGVDLSAHRGRQLDPADFREYDLILAMDDANLRDIRRLTDPFCHATIEPFIPGGHVPDPYSGGIDGFEKVHDIIEQGCDRMVERFRL